MMEIERYLDYCGIIAVCFAFFYIGGHVIVAWMK